MRIHEDNLVDQGLARYHRGRLIPIMKGAEELFGEVAEDLSTLSVEELQEIEASYSSRIEEIAADPSQYVSEEFATGELLAETRAASETLQEVRDELASREVEAVEVAQTDEEIAAEFATLGELARVDEVEETVEAEAEEVVEEAVVEEEIVAAAPARPTRRRLPAPAGDHAPIDRSHRTALVAGAGAADVPIGHEFGSATDVARSMIKRIRSFGLVPEGMRTKETVARADWSGEYPTDRRLTDDQFLNDSLIAAATEMGDIKREFIARRSRQLREGLVASGGLCAPVTPYYNLAMISSPMRPVQGMLPAFNADRGGIRFARPAALGAITTGVGTVTAANDALGGTFATKTCQVVDCPDFDEVDVEIIFHCLQFGNLGARTFPERVAQYNELVLAAHARVAESILLTGIDTASTQVTAATIGLGVVGDMIGQILAAANGLRSRNRMDPQAILRLVLPFWSIDLMISDVIRSQFQRFDTDAEKLMALFRKFNIEPSFYIDGANGKSQVFGSQDDGDLLPFPSTVTWYLYPEGSFLYVDGGVLELGVVRDSVLNSTNDFQIFGESFENVAFVGVESLAVTSTVCDSGTVSAPHATTCPIDYAA